MAVNNRSPRFKRKTLDDNNGDGRMIPLDEALPAIQKWSDIVGILWAKHAGSKAKDLKYVWRQLITTPKTRTIMNMAAQKINPKIRAPNFWPGQKFESGSEPLTALVSLLLLFDTCAEMLMA